MCFINILSKLCLLKLCVFFSCVDSDHLKLIDASLSVMNLCNSSKDHENGSTDYSGNSKLLELSCVDFVTLKLECANVKTTRHHIVLFSFVFGTRETDRSQDAFVSQL